MRRGRLASLLATVGGLGRLPVAPGTAGSFAGLATGLAWFPQPFAACSWLGAWLIGVAVSTRVERDLHVHDPSCVVIDEFTGMWLVLMAAPPMRHAPWLLAAAFGLFRFFDILKPPPLKWLARAPRGWGIMLDDVGAAAYTLLIFWVVTGLVHRP